MPLVVVKEVPIPTRAYEEELLSPFKESKKILNKLREPKN